VYSSTTEATLSLERLERKGISSARS
jgi:hypothetical protein